MSRHMKSLLFVIIVGVASILNGCVNTISSKAPPSYFNKEEFTGLVILPENGVDIVLKYELDQPNGKIVKITSCNQVKSLTENDVITHQYKLYRLLSMNCYATEKFISGESAKQSFFNRQSLLQIVSSMPATAVPNLGEDDFDLRQGKTLAEFEPSIETTDISQTIVSTVLTDNMNVNYVLLARKDINQDGVEDLIVRLDWHIPDSFGRGSMLIAISKTSKTNPIEILWRYN